MKLRTLSALIIMLLAGSTYAEDPIPLSSDSNTARFPIKSCGISSGFHMCSTSTRTGLSSSSDRGNNGVGSGSTNGGSGGTNNGAGKGNEGGPSDGSSEKGGNP